MHLNDKLAVGSHVAACHIRDETVLLDTQAGVYFGLDSVASRLWHLLLEEKSLADAIDVLVAEYDVSRAELEADVLALASELTTRGLASACAKRELPA